MLKSYCLYVHKMAQNGLSFVSRVNNLEEIINSCLYFIAQSCDSDASNVCTYQAYAIFSAYGCRLCEAGS